MIICIISLPGLILRSSALRISFHLQCLCAENNPNSNRKLTITIVKEYVNSSDWLTEDHLTGKWRKKKRKKKKEKKLLSERFPAFSEQRNFSFQRGRRSKLIVRVFAGPVRVRVTNSRVYPLHSTTPFLLSSALLAE